MTDDEAFIRAVVDAPGDDAPRLVYADWLDECGDPRGAFLRAEVTWAVPWREGDRPHRDPDLLDLAIDLDPVWVARVTRPPVGVCHDHLRLLGPGPPLAPGDIKAFERGHLTRLPDVLAALLLNHNGGTPSRNRVGFFGGRIGCFRMIAPAEWRPAAQAAHPLPLGDLRPGNSPDRDQVIEFADDRVGGGYFIGLSPGTRGVVYHAADRDPDRPYRGLNELVGVAPSLPELLAYLN